MSWRIGLRAGCDELRTEARWREDAAICLDLAFRLVQKHRFGHARVAKQALPGEVLQNQRRLAVAGPYVQFLERGTRRVAISAPRDDDRLMPVAEQLDQLAVRGGRDQRHNRSSNEVSTRSESRYSTASARAAPRWRS